MSYYINKNLSLALIFGVLFPLFVDWLFGLVLGPRVLYVANLEIALTYAVMLFLGMGGCTLAMILAHKLKRINKSYDTYLSVCALVIVLYTIGDTFFAILGSRGFLLEPFGIELTDYPSIFGPIVSVFITSMLFIFLYIIFRVRR
ncbi:hypothetical protein PSECIP111951_02168 [Pseudoalteromonas holothuriae]|uniref:Lycopene cyclase domain-containing protein n=1 Tax=Pseudoalteromonas holothuriae TaxID=2963714 RepID=A0ABN8UQC2_9GAMM|nr:hypothetical protein [Pseudoalteromonas sp. CIP111951]CAH9059929.1 hypothetical protein PSECIP111951_02168 [Pseudoalteromonas sp. CIP111951]